MHMRHMAQHQGGITMISWMILFVLVGFFAMMGIRLVPVYLEHFSVASSLKSLSEDTELRGKSPGELLNRLQRRLEVNEVTSVTADDISITREGDVNKVNVEYQVDTPFLYNIDFLIKFNDTVEVSAR